MYFKCQQIRQTVMIKYDMLEGTSYLEQAILRKKSSLVLNKITGLTILVNHRVVTKSNTY